MISKTFLNNWLWFDAFMNVRLVRLLLLNLLLNSFDNLLFNCLLRELWILFGNLNFFVGRLIFFFCSICSFFGWPYFTNVQFFHLFVEPLSQTDFFVCFFVFDDGLFGDSRVRILSMWKLFLLDLCRWFGLDWFIFFFFFWLLVRFQLVVGLFGSVELWWWFRTSVFIERLVRRLSRWFFFLAMWDHWVFLNF